MVPGGETPRLLLRPLSVEDAAQIQAIFPRWEIVCYLDRRVPWPYPPDGARRFIEELALPAMERGDSWNWTLRLKSAPQEIIGSLNLRKGDGHHRGFWLVPEQRGQWADDGGLLVGQ